MHPSHSSQVLGQNAKSLRAAKGWGSDVLVTRLGWSIEIVADLEAGRLDATLDQIDQLAAAFDIAPHELLSDGASARLNGDQRRYG